MLFTSKQLPCLPLTRRHRLCAAFLLGFACLNLSSAEIEIDPAAAEMLARQNGCFKCHSIERRKDGPSYRSVAAKYKGEGGAQAKLYHHVTSGEKVKFPDGHEENHKIIDTTDAAEIKNLIGWILSLL